MKSKEYEGAVALAAVVGVFAVVALSIVWGGFWVGLTLSVLWGWFAVPLFGLPVLTVWQAYGLALIVRALQRYKVEKNGDGFGLAMAKALAAPPFIAGLMLGVGWCVKAWS
ncbi:hypothetical protein [Acidovorax kalamii]|uniref:hypothetical protein n=1 Tax=Acidovorax kalamii TaxID=2004485 RepID=UPI001054DCD8|nr:hypothetical protein [Acidovorax kalamii]